MLCERCNAYDGKRTVSICGMEFSSSYIGKDNIYKVMT